ncbi:MAG: hypothetical protein OJF52_003723 [Nitrospira sp.]|nr:MAG: hypothetical protein OJF52_003723 [Nitrospira sp.]
MLKESALSIRQIRRPIESFIQHSQDAAQMHRIDFAAVFAEV